ncbi:unnamed protein product [Coccothraustes coccothraustes]
MPLGARLPGAAAGSAAAARCPLRPRAGPVAARARSWPLGCGGRTGLTRHRKRPGSSGPVLPTGLVKCSRACSSSGGCCQLNHGQSKAVPGGGQRSLACLAPPQPARTRERRLPINQITAQEINFSSYFASYKNVCHF